MGVENFPAKVEFGGQFQNPKPKVRGLLPLRLHQDSGFRISFLSVIAVASQGGALNYSCVLSSPLFLRAHAVRLIDPKFNFFVGDVVMKGQMIIPMYSAFVVSQDFALKSYVQPTLPVRWAIV